jgi:hypothetical protein
MGDCLTVTVLSGAAKTEGRHWDSPPYSLSAKVFAHNHNTMIRLSLLSPKPSTRHTDFSLMLHHLYPFLVHSKKSWNFYSPPSWLGGCSPWSFVSRGNAYVCKKFCVQQVYTPLKAILLIPCKYHDCCHRRPRQQHAALQGYNLHAKASGYLFS